MRRNTHRHRWFRQLMPRWNYPLFLLGFYVIRLHNTMKHSFFVVSIRQVGNFNLIYLSKKHLNSGFCSFQSGITFATIKVQVSLLNSFRFWLFVLVWSSKFFINCWLTWSLFDFNLVFSMWFKVLKYYSICDFLSDDTLVSQKVQHNIAPSVRKTSG